MSFFYRIYAFFTGKNSVNTPKDLIKEQLTEKRELPTGVTAFHEWADRIIAGAGMTADVGSQKFALANDLMHLPPTIAYESDVYFIHKLRKYAVNQVADAMRTEIRDAAKARLDSQAALAKEAEEKQTQPGEVTPPLVANAEQDPVQRIH